MRWLGKVEDLKDPPFAQYLFGNTFIAWIWLIARVYIGLQWLEAGWHKVHDPKWVETGVALKSFWEKATVVPETGRPPIAYDWYREFLLFMLNGGYHVWFAKLVAYGELLVGIALVLGALTGIAAFFGAFMNWHFLMAGATSTNPVMLMIAVALMLAWKTAGYWGLDRFILPLLGTPWQVGTVPKVLMRWRQQPKGAG